MKAARGPRRRLAPSLHLHSLECEKPRKMASYCSCRVFSSGLLDGCRKVFENEIRGHKRNVKCAKFLLSIHWPQTCHKYACSSTSGSSFTSSPSSIPVNPATTYQPSLPIIHGEVSVVYQRGLPVVTIPLPSRRERCHFTLRPVSHTVGDFLQHVRNEDRGIDRIGIKTVDGVRVSAATSIESLMQDDFHLAVNDIIYHVSPPASEQLTHEQLQRLSDVRHLVSVLYEALSVEEHQLRKEREIMHKLEEFKCELEPLEQKRQELAVMSNRRTTLITWFGLGLMATQFGVLARLTWWEYSWDIMEPVTYFVTYGTSMAAYAYFVLTKQDYLLPDVKDRQFLLNFYKRAKKDGLDVERYNELKESISLLERDLSRLRDPLHLHIPRTTLQSASDRSLIYNAIGQQPDLQKPLSESKDPSSR